MRSAIVVNLGEAHDDTDDDTDDDGDTEIVKTNHCVHSNCRNENLSTNLVKMHIKECDSRKKWFQCSCTFQYII